MKFRDLVFERTERTTISDIDEVSKILLKEYSHKDLDIILNCRSPFFRGDYASDPYLIIDPSLNKRVSPNASNNYYNSFLSNNEKWKAYPSREYSVVGSTARGKAENYHNSLYILIPLKKSSKISLAPGSDLWLSFSSVAWKNMGNLDEFGAELENFFDKLLKKKVIEKIPSDVDYKELKSTLKSITPDIYKEHATTYFKNLFKIPDGKTMYDVVSVMLSPDENNFKLIDTLDFFNNPPRRNEVWTDKKCVMIEVNHIGEIKKKVGLND
jgi:hypothetical protein